MRSRWTAGGYPCTMHGQNCGDACGERVPGMRRPVQAGEAPGKEICRASRDRDAERKKSSEARRPCAGKSRYGAMHARTVNRHRWMGRGSQGRRKKHCQGTRQNGPVTSGEGTLRGAAAEKRPKQLFSKNTGLCEAVRRSIRADACPVLEGQEEGSGNEAPNPSPSKRRP